MENKHQTDEEIKLEEGQNQPISDLDQEAPESFETLNGSERPAIEGQLKSLQDELAEAKDKYIRLYSEFENFRRRTAREKLELIQSANEQLITSFLPVIDDFERAEKSLQNVNSKELEGVQLIYNKLKKTLETNNIKAMDLSAGSDFNADFHEAITQIPAPEEKLKGKIVDVVEKGYLLNDKVIRYAKVVVGQ